MTSGDVGCIVLCGGTSRRFGGGDKTAAPFRGTTVLDHLLRELPRDGPIVCVGEARPTARDVLWVREDPPGSGPVAGIAAGLGRITTPVVAVVAGDMPYAARALTVLCAALAAHPTASSARAVDPAGRPQFLLGVHRAAALRGAIPAAAAGLPVRRVLATLETVTVPVRDLLAADIDTRDDLTDLESPDDRR